jgi:hypothetical protein
VKSKILLRVVVSTFPILLLGSCRLAQPYVSPTSGATATVQLRSSPAVGSVTLYTFDDQKQCIGMREVARNDGPAKPLAGNVRLVGDQPATFYLSYKIGAFSCDVAMTFKPISSRRYVLAAAAAPASCVLAIVDITDPGMPVAERRWISRKLEIGANGARCASVDVEAGLAKPHQRNLSGMQVSDLQYLLPPAPRTDDIGKERK